MANEDKVSYFNLPAGNYVFQIRKFLDLESVNRVSFSIKQDRSWLTYAIYYMESLLIAIFIFVFRKRKTIVSATTPVESVNLDQPETKIPASSTESYVKLSDEEAGDVIHTLKKYMQDQQPYLWSI